MSKSIERFSYSLHHAPKYGCEAIISAEHPYMHRMIDLVTLRAMRTICMSERTLARSSGASIAQASGRDVIQAASIVNEFVYDHQGKSDVEGVSVTFHRNIERLAPEFAGLVMPEDMLAEREVAAEVKLVHDILTGAPGAPIITEIPAQQTSGAVLL